MYEAWVGAIGRAVQADEYGDLSSDMRLEYAATLLCTGCDRSAYFIRQARNGRAACFGARPHGDDCPMTYATTENAATLSASEDEPSLTAEDELVLTPVRARARHRYAGSGASGPVVGAREGHPSGVTVQRKSRPTIGLNALLRRLVRHPASRSSSAKLVLPDGTVGTIRTLCIDVVGADLRLKNRRRLYWGTIRYANDDDGGAWLNLGRKGAPALHLDRVTVHELLDRHDVDDLEDLQGASFIGYLPLRKSATTDRLFLFPKDLDWFAIRLPDEDPI
jgi:hypothetical protein